MIYVYRCEQCNTSTEIIKSISQIDDPEVCPKGHSMNRTISWQGQMKMGDISFKSDYYHAFGKTLTNPHQLKDELSRAKDSGNELVAVGNDKSVQKPKEKWVDKEVVGKALYQQLGKSRGRFS